MSTLPSSVEAVSESMAQASESVTSQVLEPACAASTGSARSAIAALVAWVKETIVLAKSLVNAKPNLDELGLPRKIEE
ncbi:unnamed protein product [Phytophthora lilii]|uniref:Unnamed protein product n=1 Tax=Phytophthora lilii TaxID=2077276 RepID=A0A9W6XK94_9STRA|nr:unnamed protein product [Phytophthora lilii]